MFPLDISLLFTKYFRLISGHGLLLKNVDLARVSVTEKSSIF